ncbi:O-acyltransferase like protein [Eumeta japonica]|uniref:O-acyltransferase like protein n=1 Tax=Eumeta variegata TaxID=151549 RepID=A0A4C1U2D8_EUMVA|nr:O-acyltransferase like protein [Eumeta japonica]
MFYLQRYLRMFPLLAAAILLQMSLAHHISDGPIWTNVARDIEFCRENWWAALLHVQNYVSYGAMCIGHTWYLSVDMQLYWISPLVLVWLCAPSRGGGRRAGWCAVTMAMLISLLAATVYCFLNDFPPQSMIRLEDDDRYMKYYYVNTLTRAPPFFVGMLFGYVLHLKRHKMTKLPKILICLFWTIATAFLTFAIFIHYPPMQTDYDNQLLDNFINSFMRSFWATALGWIVFACKHGYGGPVNWLLSLQMWKLPARLSYAMYLLHMTVMTVMNDMQLSPVYFTQWNMVGKCGVNGIHFEVNNVLVVNGVALAPGGTRFDPNHEQFDQYVFNLSQFIPLAPSIEDVTIALIFRFFGDLVLVMALAFVVTLAVDSPFSTLQKIILQGGKVNKSQQEPAPNDSSLSQVAKNNDLTV